MSSISVMAKLIDAGYNLEELSTAAIGSFNTAIGGLAQAARAEWIRLAQAKLGSSRETYIQGLNQASSFKRTAIAHGELYEIMLVGAMPNNFEFGMPSYDMKAVRPGWLGGRKAKTSKDGHKYIVIPFRHSEFGNTPYTGKAAAVSSPTLKAQLRNAVRDYGLNRMVRTGPGGAFVAEGAVKRIPKGAPVHPFLQGLTRVQKGLTSTTSKGKQRGSSQLMTWRVMSENSPAESWIHPGITAANILPEVERYVNRELDKIMERILGA